MTADCLPVLFCDRAGTVVAAAHAGWRGLLAGVLEATIKKAWHAGQRDYLAWLGPAIGPQCFEVGDEVRATFVDKDPAAAIAFVPQSRVNGWPIFTPWPVSVCNRWVSIQSAVVIFVPLPRLKSLFLLSPRWCDRTHGQPDLAGSPGSGV
jgi:hypothetical protein